jgi:hypothetical protein
MGEWTHFSVEQLGHEPVVTTGPIGGSASGYGAVPLHVCEAGAAAQQQRQYLLSTRIVPRAAWEPCPFTLPKYTRTHLSITVKRYSAIQSERGVR